MRSAVMAVLAAGLAVCVQPARSDSLTVANYQGGPDHAGHYVVPGLTWASAPSAHLTPGFKGSLRGEALAQPLYWHPTGAAHGLIITATTGDFMQALDPVTGSTVWTTPLGTAVPAAQAECQGKKPRGIDGTPVIDDAAGVIYVDSFALDATGAPQHLIYGLSLANGAILPGWPVNIATALQAQGFTFTPFSQDQRGALALVGGKLYVPFGGNGGDCGTYHGWVVGLDVSTQTVSGVWQTRGEKGGIWAPGGVISDGTSLFVGTGNSLNPNPKSWDDSIAIIRVPADLSHSSDTHDFFAPPNWAALDNTDLDLGGTAPTRIDVPTSNGTAQWLLALGKDGKAYVLDRANLGGIGGSLAVQPIANSHLITAPATYTASDGVYVAFKGSGTGCPPPAANIALTVIKITAQPQPAISTTWCAALAGTGSPTVTTSDGVNDPIVWMVGSEGDNLLHAFSMTTGQNLLTGSAVRIAGAYRFNVVLPAEGRLFVPAGSRLFSISFGP